MSDGMRDELRYVEAEHGVVALLAVEAGSRAWGLASEDSDYDVRFVYLRPMRDYLRLQKLPDTITWHPNDVTDFVGWDLRKYLTLLQKSNPQALEWLACPTYLEDGSFSAVRDLAGRCFDSVAVAQHWHSFAMTHKHKLLEKKTPTAKAYLYVIRAVCSCRWVVERQSMAPVVVDDLVTEVLDDPNKAIYERLAAEKRAGNGRMCVGHLDVLDAWLEVQLDMLMTSINALGRRMPVSWDEMDETFMGVLAAQKG